MKYMKYIIIMKETLLVKNIAPLFDKKIAKSETECIERHYEIVASSLNDEIIYSL